MRKENLSTHIQRKHPNQYNPFPQMKLKQSDCNFSQPKRPDPWNFRSPQYDLSDAAQLFEDSKKFQDVLQEIKQWNKLQLACLLTAIFKLQNFIS
jgi:hypothetical protein